MTLLSTAYAGTADIDQANIDALLNQILPDGPLGMVYVPDEVPRRAMPGLVKVVSWLEQEIGKEGTIPVRNLVEALLERNAKLDADGEETDELALVMLYNPSSGLDTALAKEAHEAGIRVINLSAAGDDLIFEDEAEAVTDEAVTDEAVDGGTPVETPAPSPAEQVAKAAEAGKAAAGRRTKPAPEVPVTAEVPPGVAIQFTINLDPASVQALAQAIVGAMGAQAQAVVEPAEPLASVTPIGTTGGNAADPAGQPPNTAVYYHNVDEAKYRPARGTKRRGEERVFLTPDQVAEAKAKGMLG